MIIAIDVDQTYTADPVMWQKIIPIIQDHGHQVVVVTCRPEWDKINMGKLIELVGEEYCFFTRGEAKIPYMQEIPFHVDIWIDDTPATITGGGSVMYTPNSKSEDNAEN